MSVTANTLEPVLAKLELNVALSAAERSAFLALPITVRSMPAGAHVVREGDPVRTCSAVLAGFAYRHKTVTSGARQIISVHMTGDLLDVQNALFRTASNSVQMMTPGKLAFIPVAALESLMAAHPGLLRAIWLSTLIDSSVFSEWIANVGRRDARSRVSHLLCEFAVRMKAAGLAESCTYDLPMTQEQIGDATGLTSVHVNRTMQGLRQSGLISRDKRAITIEDWAGLVQAGGFDSAYLHQAAADAPC